MSVPVWTVHTFDIDSASNERVIPFANLSYAHVLSDAGSAVIGAPAHEPTGLVIEDNIKAAQRHIEIMRDDVRVWAGRIWNTEVTAPGGIVSFDAKGYYELLRRKYNLPKNETHWDDTDVWDIAWDIIEYCQSLRTMGITRGMGGESTKPHTDYDWNWYDFSSAAEAIEQVATLPGKSFYFRIDEDRTWLTYTKPGPETGVFALTTDNIVSLTVRKSGDDTARETIVRGQGSGVDTHYAHTLLDEGGDTYGRIMILIDRPDVRSDNTLADLADLAATRHSNVRIQCDAEIEVGPDSPFEEADWEAFGPGESIQVTYEDGFIQVDDYLRVAAKTVSIDGTGKPKHSITFDSQWDSQV